MNKTKAPVQWDAMSTASQSVEELGVISQLVDDVLVVEQMIQQAENGLNALKEKHKRLTEIDIPEKMTALGVDSITTTSGAKLTIKPFYQASIKRLYEDGPYDPGAFKWLEDNKHAGVIKTQIAVDFPRGGLDKAKTLYKSLNDTCMEQRLPAPKFIESVHAQTLKALVREIMEDGKTLPEQFFNVFSGRVAHVKPPE